MSGNSIYNVSDWQGFKRQSANSPIIVYSKRESPRQLIQEEGLIGAISAKNLQAVESNDSEVSRKNCRESEINKHQSDQPTEKKNHELRNLSDGETPQHSSNETLAPPSASPRGRAASQYTLASLSLKDVFSSPSKECGQNHPPASENSQTAPSAAQSEEAKVAPVEAPWSTRNHKKFDRETNDIAECKPVPFNDLRSFDPIIDTPKVLQLIPHPLFDIVAALTRNSLAIFIGRHLDLVQSLISPFASPFMDVRAATTSSLRLPFRMHDTARMFPSMNSTTVKRLLHASWHRESLTLAVASSQAIMIFKPVGEHSPKVSELSCASKLEFCCARYIHVGWPCTWLFWLGDTLMTRSCPKPPGDHNMSGDLSRGRHERRSTLSTSQIFIWKCQFRRYVETISEPKHNYCYFDISSAALSSPSTLTESVISAVPMLRHHWSPSDAPLAEFLSCLDQPDFSWRALAGCNTKPEPPIPVLTPEEEEDELEHDRISVQVRRLVPHPGNRFLAALYSVSITPSTKSRVKAPDILSIPLSDDSSSTDCAVPSPVVRLWSLRPGIARNAEGAKHMSEQTEILKGNNGTNAPSKTRRRKLVQPTSNKNGGKSRSCFLSGIAGLFSHRRNAKNRKIAGGVRSMDQEIQGHEWLIMKQLTRMTTQDWRRPSSFNTGHTEEPLDPNLSLMTLMAAKGLVSKTDVVNYHAAILTLRGKRKQRALEPMHALKSRISDVSEETLSAIPAVLDGPYFCTSLNHRAPVLKLIWKDEGPLTDEVFIPAVACTLTADNCITIWLESPPDTTLWFEAVIIMRLESSPVWNFFNALDTIRRFPRQDRLNSRDQPLCSSLSIVVESGLSSVPFEESGVTLCWLSSHKVSSTWHAVHNLCRLARAEAKTRLLDLELLKGDTTADTDSTSPEPPSVLGPTDRFLGFMKFAGMPQTTPVRQVVEETLKGVLDLRPCGHVAENSLYMLSAKQNYLTPTTLAIIAETANPVVPMLAVTHKQRATDFLFVAESHKGTQGLSVAPINEICGLWVYTFRELASQPRGSPAVKQLLEPHHLPLPCKTHVEFDEIKRERCRPANLESLNTVDEVSALVGHSVIVTDGILLPACIVKGVTVAAELISLLIRPRAISKASTRRADEELVVQYEVRLERCVGPFIEQYHCLKIRKLLLREEFTKTPLKSMSLKDPQPELEFSSQLSKYLRQLESEEAPPTHSTVISRLKFNFWRLLQEHALFPSLLLALDNRGWLYVGSINLQGTEGSSFVFDLDTQTQSSSPMIEQDRGGRGVSFVASDISGDRETQTTQNEGRENTTDAVPRISGGPEMLSQTSVPQSSFICVHGLTTPWLGENLRLSEVNSSQKNQMISELSSPDLPALKHVVWLPLATRPAVALGVTDPDGQLIALEIDCVAGQSCTIRGLPFLGCYCGSLLDVQYLLPVNADIETQDYTQEEPPSRAFVAQVDVAPRSHMECLIAIRISLELTEAQTLDWSKHTREEHVLVLLCRDGAMNGGRSSTENATTAGKQRMALSLEVLFDGFLDFSPLNFGRAIGLKESKLQDVDGDSTKEILGDHSAAKDTKQVEDRPIEANPENSPTIKTRPKVSIVSVTPQLSLCSTPTVGGIVALLAAYPPLDVSDQQPVPGGISSLFGGSSSLRETLPGHSTIGLYEILEVKSLRLGGWVVVPTFQQNENASSNHIVALSLNQEWLAVMTSRVDLYFFSLLDSPPLPAAASLPRMFFSAAVSLGLSKAIPMSLSIPVFTPTVAFNFNDVLETLRLESEAKKRLLETEIISQNEDSATRERLLHKATGEVQSYFKKSAKLTDFSRKGSDISPPLKPGNDSQPVRKDKSKVDGYAVGLKPQSLGSMPIISFRRTRGDGLCLMILLSCHSKLKDSSDKPDLLLTRTTGIELPPSCVPLILIRVRRDGIETWTRPVKTLCHAGPEMTFHGAAWSARSDQFLLVASQTLGCLQDFCFPPLLIKLPQYLKNLARSASSPRPIYHPASLYALLGRLSDLSLVLKILKRLLEALQLWLYDGRPLPPTIDLPIAFLCAKPVSWVLPESRDTTLRDQLLERLKIEANVEGNSSQLSSPRETFVSNTSSDVNEASASKPNRQTGCTESGEEVANIKKDEKKLCPTGTQKQEVATALFDDTQEEVDDYFTLISNDSLKPSVDEDPDLQGVNVIGDETPKPALFVKETDAIPSVMPLKSLKDTFASLDLREIEEAAPLLEASKTDLERLVRLLDISNENTAERLPYYTSVCPHLSVIESAQLVGLIRMILDLLETYNQAREQDKIKEASTNILRKTPPLLVAAWKDVNPATCMSASVDVAGSRFLLAYDHTLALTASHVELARSVAGLRTALSEKKEMALEEITQDSENIIDWHSLFPAGLCSVGSLEADGVIINPVEAPGGQETKSFIRFCLTTCDLCWAVHCESDDILLSRVLALWRRSAEAISQKSPKLSWPVLRQAGVGFWLRNPSIAIKIASEDVPRDIYARQPTNSKDPDAVALWYVSTGRVAVLRALYKAEKNFKVVEFLSHDFSDERWRAAAVKNAYALVRQRRHELAVSFFILGGSYLEAMDVCCGQMDDPQLALFLALILEHRERTEGVVQAVDSVNTPVRNAAGLRTFVLSEKLLPIAIKVRDCWLQSLLLWLLERYEEAVVVTLPPDVRPQLKELSALSSKRFHQNSNDITEPSHSYANSISLSPQGTISDQQPSGSLLLRITSEAISCRHSPLFILEPESVTARNTISDVEEGLYFGSSSIRYSPSNPTLPLLRRHLLGTLQLKRALKKSLIASEFLELIKKVCNMTESPHDSGYLSSNSEIYISATTVAAVVILCEELVNLLDLGESLLYCLTHRFPFQGLQHFNDLRVLKCTLASSSSGQNQRLSGLNDRFSVSRLLTNQFGKAGGNLGLRFRWTCAVGFTRHVCDALGYLTAASLKATESDILWMDELFDETVESFEPMTLQLASIAWKRVVADHGSESYHKGEDFFSWMFRQFEGPAQLPCAAPLLEDGEFWCFEARKHLELFKITTKESADAVQNMNNRFAKTKPAAGKQKVIEMFSEALRGLPAWSLMSERHEWTEGVIFHGLTTCFEVLLPFLSEAMRHDAQGKPYELVARTLSAQTAVRVALAWIMQPDTRLSVRLSMMSIVVVTTSCVVAACATLLLKKMQMTMHDLRKESALEQQSADDGKVGSAFWRNWPLNIGTANLWTAAALLLRHANHVDACYAVLLDKKDILIFDHVEHAAEEVAQMQHFLFQGILMPSQEYLKLMEGSLTHNEIESPVVQTVQASKYSSVTDPLKNLLQTKQEVAREVLINSLRESEVLRQGFADLALSLMQRAVADRLCLGMKLSSNVAEVLLDSVPTAESTEWRSSLQQTIQSFSLFQTNFSNVAHAEHDVRMYSAMISRVAIQFPYLAIALSSPSTLTQQSPYGEKEVYEEDSIFSKLALASICPTADSIGFKFIWRGLECLGRLQLLLARGPVTGLPTAISLGCLTPDQLPLFSRAIACVKDAPICIAIDHAAGVPLVHHSPSIGPTSLGVPLLGLCLHGGSRIQKPGLAVLSLSTSRGIWEVNLAHSLMFHKLFGGANPERPDSAGPPSSLIPRSGAKESTPLFQLPLYCSNSPQAYDDDEAVHLEIGTSGKFRLYDVAAEDYEKLVAEQTAAVFFHRRKRDVVEIIGERMAEEIAKAEKPQPPNLDVQMPVVHRLTRKLNHVRPHWHSGHGKILKLPKFNTRMHQSETGSKLSLFQFNFLLELLSRGLFNSLGDAAVTHLEAVGSHRIGKPEMPLIGCGLSLLPLPSAKRLDTDASLAPRSSVEVSTSLESATAWIRQITVLQQRLSRNFLVELQLSCLPPLATMVNSPNSSTMSLMASHPFLPVCAGVVADSQVVHSSQGSMLIALWKIGEPHIRGLGTLALGPAVGKASGMHSSHTSDRPATASVDSSNTKSYLATGNPGDFEVSKPGSATTGRRPGTADSVSTHPLIQADSQQKGTVSYAEAGPVKDLAWNTNGDKIVAAHHKGWVTIWSLRIDMSTRLASDTPRASREVALHLGSTAVVTPKNLPSCVGLPSATFKAHTSSCRFASLISSASGEDTLLITSGRGLPPTSLIFCLTPEITGAQKRSGESSAPAASGVVSVGPDEGIVCIWDLGGGDRLGPPSLLMADLKFEKGNYATHFAVWSARQCIIYSTRRGEVRLISLRHFGAVCTLINPVAASILRSQLRKTKKNANTLKSKIEDQSAEQNTTTSPSPGIMNREIVKVFLLEETQRLVTCYEDAMIRVWDLSELCSSEFNLTGKLRSVVLPNKCDEAHNCIPLLWETPNPVHTHDSSKLSLASSLIGAVFNIAPGGGNPRALLDATLASPNHLVTLGADGLTYLTRI